MLNLSDIPEKRREKAERWIRIVSRQNKSGLTVREYCRKESVNPSTFYYWCNYLNGTTSAPSSTVHRTKTKIKTKGQALIAVKIRPHSSGSVSNDRTLGVLHLPKGALLKIYDVQALSALLKELV